MQSKDGPALNDRQTIQADLTQGSICKQLVLFALPLLASSLIQQLYNTVDLVFIGQLLGKQASAAVGSSSLLVACLVGFFTGMSIGSNILAAQAFGSRNYEELKTVVSMVLVLSFAGGAVLLIAGYALAPVFLRWLHVPDDIYGLAVEYIRIYVLSLIAMAGYNIGSGVLRGLGDSRSPMRFQLIGGIGNVLANALFIGCFGWGVRGAAVATLLSQSVAAILVFCRLYCLDARYSLRLREIRIRAAVLKKIMRVGVPAGIQAMTVTLSNLIVQNHINRLGVDTIAAFTAYFKVELFVYLPIVAIGQANVTFTGQNIGAQRPDRAVAGTRTSTVLGLGIALATSLLLLLFSAPAYGLFTKDSKVIAIGVQIAMVTLPFYFLYVFLEVFSSFIRGMGKTVPPTLIILANMCIIRPAYVTVVSGIWPGAQAIAWVYPLTWLTTSLCMTICFLSYKRRLLAVSALSA